MSAHWNKFTVIYKVIGRTVLSDLSVIIWLLVVLYSLCFFHCYFLEWTFPIGFQYQPR